MVKVLTIYFFQNNPQGTFLAGDLVEVFFDTGSLSFTVKRNGSVISSGSDITPAPLLWTGFMSANQDEIKSEAYETLWLCAGSDGVSFFRQTSFPYLYYTAAPSPFCGSPVVCDLQINPGVTVVNESIPGALDGSITVTATSSRPIQYKLEPFTYGNGQAAGTFTGLGAGTYRVFVRDEAGCSSSIVVEVGQDSNYGVKIRIDYADIYGRDLRLEIIEKDYSGPVLSKKGSENPFTLSLRGEGDENIFKPVLSMEAVINLIIESESEYDFLFTTDADKFKVRFFQEGNILWSGFILPHQHNSNINNYPNTISFTAVDRIASLSDVLFDITGDVRILDVFVNAQRKLNVKHNIHSGCNIHATSLTVTPSDDPLAYTYVDADKYMGKSYLDVISDLLTSFGARLIVFQDTWYIQRIDELTGSYAYRLFNFNGQFISNGTFSAVKQIRNRNYSNRLVWRGRSGTKKMLPSYGRIDVNYNLHNDNILRNGNFRLKTYESNILPGVIVREIDITGFTLVPVDTPTYTYSEQIDNNNVAFVMRAAGKSYLMSAGYPFELSPNVSLRIRVRCKTDANVPGKYVRIKMRVSYGTWHLKSDGTWVNSPNEFAFYYDKFGEYAEFQFVAQPIINFTTTSGLELKVRIYSAYWRDVEFETLADLKAKPTTTAGLGTKTELLDGTYAVRYYELEDNTDTPDDYSIIRPNDFNLTTNPVQWILKERRVGLMPTPVSVYYDYVKLDILRDGREPPTMHMLSYNAQNGNKDVYQTEISTGSLVETIQVRDATYTEYLVFDGNLKLIQRAYVKDSNGNPLKNWKRDAVTEDLLLHDILLNSLQVQLTQPQIKLSGELVSENDYLYPVNVVYDDINTDKYYVITSWSYMDKEAAYSVELIQKQPVGDDVDYGSAFSLGFSKGFDA